MIVVKLSVDKCFPLYTFSCKFLQAHYQFLFEPDVDNDACYEYEHIVFHGLFCYSLPESDDNEKL